MDDPWLAGRWTSGAFVHGGVVGVTRSARSHPQTTSFLCKALSRRTGQPFSAVTVLVNCHSDEHVDCHNQASCPNLAWNLAGGPQVTGIKFQNGNLPLPSNAWASFWPRVPHSSLPGDENQVFLVGYTPRNLERLWPTQLSWLS